MRARHAVGVALGVVLAIAVLAGARHLRAPRPSGALWLEGAPTRPLEARLSHPAADGYRPHGPSRSAPPAPRPPPPLIFAATVDLPDVEAGPFFEAVRSRIRAGEAPAVALRDERREWLRRPGSDWVRHVLLFE